MSARRLSAADEHVVPRGLPGPLPAGEALLWQGAPCWRSVMRHCCHVQAAAAYFALLLAFSAVCSHWDTGSAAASLRSLLRLGALAGVALGLLAGFAWLVARTTVYTITDRRVVLTIGVALQFSLNLPFRLIDTADLCLHRDGSGDIALDLRPGPRHPGYVVLWPHARPWRLARPQPMLRGLPDAARAAQLLGRALAASAAQPAPPTPAVTIAEPASRPHAAAAA